MVLSLRHYFLIALLIGALLLTYFVIAPFFAPVALGIVFAVVLQPVFNQLKKELSGSDTLAALFTVVLTLLVILVPMAIIGYQLLVEAESIYGSLADGSTQATLITGIRDLGPRIDGYIPGSEGYMAQVASSIDEYAKLALTWIIQHLGIAFSGISAFVLDLFIFFVTLYYVLRDGVRLRSMIVELSPLKDTDDEAIFGRLELAINSVVRGKLVVALIQGIFSGVGLFLFGVPNPILWAVAATVAALIPPFGTSLIIVPAAAYLGLAGHTGAAVGLLVWGAVAGIIDNVIGPSLMSKGTDLHPLLVLLSVLGGLSFYGPVGIFLGPLTLALFPALLSLYQYLARDGHVR